MPKPVYILIVIIVLVVGTKFLLQETNTEPSTNYDYKPLLSYSDIKSKYLNKDYSHFDNDGIALALIEFKYQNELHSLILVRDSVVFLITKSNTVIANESCSDSLIFLSNKLLNTIDQLSQNEISLANKKPFSKDNKILIKYKHDNNIASKIQINTNNVNHSEYENIIQVFLKLLYNLENKHFGINEIIQSENESQ